MTTPPGEDVLDPIDPVDPIGVDRSVAVPDPGDGRGPTGVRGRVLTVVGVLSLVVPVVAYVAFIHHYALDVVWSDQWSDVALLRHAHDGTLGLATLWAQHTSNRILVPNLVVLALGAATHLDTVTEAYLSAVLAVAAAALLILAHRRRMPDTPWLAYCPVVLLLLTVVGGNPYYGGTNTLWGFTLGLYVVLAALAGALWLLDRPALGAPVVAGAVALAVIGSYSATQGLLIWPAGLVLLWLRDRPGRVLVTWVAAGVATTALFFVHYDSAAGMSQPGYLASHPGASASFFLFSLGDNVLGRVLTAPPSGSGLTSDVLGLVVVALAVWVVVRFRRRDVVTGSPLGVALVVYGLLFTAVVTASRAWQGFFQAGRYLTFEVLVWVGCYLAVLGRRALTAGDGVAGDPPARRARPDRVVGTVAVLLVALVAVQVVVGTPRGLRYAADDRRHQLDAADVAVHMDEVDDAQVYATDGGWAPSWVRPLDRFARTQRLSLFDTPLARSLARAGVFARLQSSVTAPAGGAAVSGRVPLVAEVHLRSGVAGLDFAVSPAGAAGHGPARTLPAVPSSAGWTATWDTSESTGWWDVRAVVVHVGGIRATGDPVTVLVRAA